MHNACDSNGFYEDGVRDGVDRPVHVDETGTVTRGHVMH
jgi:hypothetical protein